MWQLRKQLDEAWIQPGVLEVNQVIQKCGVKSYGHCCNSIDPTLNKLVAMVLLV